MSMLRTHLIQRARSEGGSSLQIGALLAGMALLVLGNGLQGTLIGVRAGAENMSKETIGLVMSAYFVGYAIGSVFVPHLVQNVGHIRAFAALAAIASAVSLAFILYISPITWLLLRILHGACFAGLVIVVESWLNAATDRAGRGRVLAIYGIVIYGAWAASQPLLGLSPPTGFVLFCIVSICLSVALVPITLTKSGVPGVVKASRPSLKRLYAISPLGLVGSFMIGLTVSAFFGMAPTFAQSIGLNDSGIAAFVSVTLVGGLAMQWPLGWLSDFVDRRLVIIACALATSLAAAALAWNAESNFWMLLALAGGLGAFVLPIYALCVAHMNDQISENEVITATSGLILVYGVGSIFGPFTASLFMGRIGPAGLFVFMAGATLLYAVYAIYRTHRTPSVSEHQKDSFVAVPQTTHAAMPLHKHGSGKAKGPTAPQ
jgi:MFS family permease